MDSLFPPAMWYVSNATSVLVGWEFNISSICSHMHYLSGFFKSNASLWEGLEKVHRMGNRFWLHPRFICVYQLASCSPINRVTEFFLFQAKAWFGWENITEHFMRSGSSPLLLAVFFVISSNLSSYHQCPGSHVPESENTSLPILLAWIQIVTHKIESRQPHHWDSNFFLGISWTINIGQKNSSITRMAAPFSHHFPGILRSHWLMDSFRSFTFSIINLKLSHKDNW